MDFTTEEWEVNFDIGIAADSQEIMVKEKKRAWFSNKAFPIVDSNGNLLNVVIQHEDITDRKRDENVIKKSEERFRELFEYAPVGYHELDKEGKIVRVNKTELEMLGYTEEEMIGRYVWGFYEESEISRQAVLAKLLDNKIEKKTERVIRRKDGTSFPVLVQDVLLHDQDEKCIGIRTAIQDITEQQKHEDEIRTVNQKLSELLSAKDKFFSIIAHDLRSPLSGIIGFSNILKEEARNLDISTIEEYVGMVNSSSLQLSGLLENLLEWARLQEGQITYSPSLVILKELGNKVVALMSEYATLKNTSIFNQIPDDLTIQADENMIKATIRNLVSNAIKFTPEGGNVVLSAEKSSSGLDGEVVVSITDNGTGIKPEFIEKLFDIRSKNIVKGTKNEIGSGLGLILCKEFVEKHGGKLWVESNADIQSGPTWSVFKFSLPYHSVIDK